MAKLLDLSVYGPGHISNILQVDASVYAKAFVTDGGKDTQVVRGDGTLASISSLYVGNAATASSVPWSGITGKPTTFTPSAHTHTASDVSGLPTSLKNPYALTFGSKTYDGSAAATITASDLGALTSITKSMVEGVLTGDITSHTHSYLPLSGGTITGLVTFANNEISLNGLFLSYVDGALRVRTQSGDSYFGMMNDSFCHIYTNAPSFYMNKPLYVDNGNAVIHSGNYNSYAPTLTGTGASGTWGISISGNAATATYASYLGTSSSYYTKSSLDNALAGKAASSHTHTKSQITDFPSSMPASDVYSWAKASTKPTYNFGEIGPGIAAIGDGANRLMFRTNPSYASGIYHSTPGNEALVFANSNGATSWIFANIYPANQTEWTSLTPCMQIKNGRVVINKLIANNTNASYNLDVNGSANATTLYENGTRVALSGHTHSYLPLSGGTLNGNLSLEAFKLYWNGDANGSYISSNGMTDMIYEMRDGHIFRVGGDEILSIKRYSNYKLQVTGSANATTLYENGTRVALSGHTHNYAGSSSAGGAATSVVVTDSNANSTYRMVWHNGNSLYSTDNIYCNPSTDSIYASAFYETSDERLKDFENSVNVDLNLIRSIPKMYFRWKKNPNKLQIGTSAQAVKQIYPELVSSSEDGMLSVDYSKLSIVALSAIDKLHLENQDLKREINILKQEIEKLKGQI